MTDVEKKITLFFNVCEKADRSLKTVDMYEQHKHLIEVRKTSKNLFINLENLVNPMGVKDLKKDIMDKTLLLKLYYVILRSLFLYSKKGIPFYEGVRSAGSSDLAKVLLGKLNYYQKFGHSSWIKNDDIYYKGIMQGISDIPVHPTLLQNLVRCLTKTLTCPELSNQNIPDYLQKFEMYILYYLETGPAEDHIYLDFI